MECAFLSAFRCFGLMKAVLVTNRITSRMKAFADRYQIELQVEPALDSADGVKALCLDSVAKMHTRFKTDYVLTLQTDGFPINSGLEEFVGPYDYIGAPFPGHIYWYDFYPYPRYAVGNGGFSLRSHAICEASSVAYKKISRWVPYSQFIFGDDVFYCKTMPFFSPSCAAASAIRNLTSRSDFRLDSIIRRRKGRHLDSMRPVLMNIAGGSASRSRTSSRIFSHRSSNG